MDSHKEQYLHLGLHSRVSDCLHVVCLCLNEEKKKAEMLIKTAVTAWFVA